MNIKKLRELLELPQSFRALTNQIRNLENSLDILKKLAARNLEVSLANTNTSFPDREFRVSSQFGDDGIIQFLLEKVAPTSTRFIEFGTQDYSEANTRYLLEAKNWSGLILDGDSEAMEALKSEVLYWRHDLTAVGAFVTRDNINELFRSHGFSGSIGLLSIDIDGNDYWVWERIECIDADIVVVEYNSLFGPSLPVTVPYDPAFDRKRAHFSCQYWGASLKALEILGSRLGYKLVGCNSAGNNAYFIKKTCPHLPARSAESAYIRAKWREGRDESGRLNFPSPENAIKQIGNCDLINIETEALCKVSHLFPAK